MLTICITLSLILFSQKAMAGAQISVNLGFPGVQFEMYGGDPYEEYDWIEGYYVYAHPSYIWVPGHWVPVEHDHIVYVQRPPVYHQYRGYPQQNPPRGSYGQYNRQGSYDYNGTSHEGYNRQQNPQHGQNNSRGHNAYNNTGQGKYNNQQDQPQGQYYGQRNNSYRTGGNWMNNINNKIIRRQVNHNQ